MDMSTEAVPALKMLGWELTGLLECLLDRTLKKRSDNWPVNWPERTALTYFLSQRVDYAECQGASSIFSQCVPFVALLF